MKTLPPVYLLAALLLATTPALRAQSVSNVHSYLNYSSPTGELLDKDAEPQMCGFRGERHAVQVSATNLSTDQELHQQLEQLTKKNLALDFRNGTLKTQVELLTRRLAALEEAAPLAETYGDQPR